MNKTKIFLGIDLGTSSVKCIYLNEEKTVTVKADYSEQSLAGYRNALKEAIRKISEQIDIKDICAIGLSSQVGTYIVGDTVIPWNSSAGEDQLKEIKEIISEEEFIEEISMRHPDIISYPLPRLKYIKEKYGNTADVFMPKEYLIKLLTGNAVTDKYSYRGLYNFKTGGYSYKLLKKLSIEVDLPQIKEPDSIAGYVSEAASKELNLPFGIPVFTGCNDFFAGLVGMGVISVGDKFDLSGTSEHIGYISDSLSKKGVSGNYFCGYATYAGTKSGGESCDLAINSFDAKTLSEKKIREYLDKNPPVFLPYLSGERAPIYDENAKGVFFGITAKTDKTLFGYSILEGVVFSVYHIAESIGFKESERPIICAGGFAKDKVMAKLKAELFSCEIFATDNSNASALGAALIAAKGSGYLKSFTEAKEKFITGKIIATPGDRLLREKLIKRYEIYKSLYPSLKDEFKKLRSN